MDLRSRLRRLATLAVGALCTVALAAPAVSAYADPGDPYQEATPHITIKKAERSADPALYPDRFVAIQIFKADVNPDDNRQLSNIEWGASVKGPSTDSIDTLLSAMCESDWAIGDYNEAADPGDSSHDDYKDIKTFGELFCKWLEKNVPGTSSPTTDAHTGVTKDTVTAHDVAQFLSEFAYVAGGKGSATPTEYPSPSIFTKSEVAAAFASIVSEEANLDASTRDVEGNANANAGNAGKWTSYGLKDGGSKATDLVSAKSEGQTGQAWVIDSVARGTTSVGLDPGYYVVLDRFAQADGRLDAGLTGPDHDYFAVSEMIMQVVDDDGVVVDIKSDVPQVDKKIVGVDPSVDANSIAAGNKATFIITGTFPENVMSYHHTGDGESKYAVTLTDTLGASLAVDKGSVEVYLGTDETAPDELAGAEKVKVDSTNVTVDAQDHKVTVTIPNIFSMVKDGDSSPVTIDDGVVSGHRSVIYVRYSATLTGAADSVSGTSPNGALANKVVMTYSNDPYSEGTGTTPEDKTQHYTYGIDLKKTETSFEGDPLAGAGFSILQASAGSPVTQAPIQDGHNGCPGEGAKVAWFTRTGDNDENYVYTFAGWHEPVVADATYVSWYNESGTHKTGHMHEGMLVDEVNAAGKGIHNSDDGSDQTAQYYQVLYTGSTGTAKVRGLGEGYYTVIESLTPMGHDVMVPYSWAFSAEETEDASVLTVSGQQPASQTGRIADADTDGIANLDLVNLKGIDLPITGGMGTIALYGAAVVLIAAGAGYLIWRRRQTDEA